MKRAVAAALLAALAVAAPAAAKAPPVHGGSALAQSLPLKAFSSLDPPVHLFGTPITARIAVVGDRRWVDAATVHVAADFSPYRPVGPPSVVRTGSGRLLQITWTWRLDCLTKACIPVMHKSDVAHVFHFAPARVEYLSPTGTVRYAFYVRFQRVLVYSELSPKVIAALGGNTIDWQYPITPVAAPHYRVSPDLAFWLAVALAVLLGASGLALAARWARRFLPSASARGPLVADSSLERALTLFFWARANGDETLQRKALERVADELPFDVHDLSETARALAWSPETPDEEGVQEISERAGIHRHDGESQL